jgi:hypothetical protein
MMRGSRNVPAPVSDTSPRNTKTHPNFARVDAMRTSHCVANSAPMPIAGPSTAAMTGFGQATIWNTRGPSGVAPRTPRWSSGVSLRSDRSVPAQNDPPVPSMMTARTASSCPARCTAAKKSAFMAYVMAFRFSGRSMMTCAMPSRVSERIIRR